MSVDATVKSKIKAEPVGTLSSHREQRLRAVQVKKVGLSALKPLGYGDTQIMTATVAAGMSFAETMLPEAWTNVAHIPARDALSSRNLKDAVGCLVIVEPEDGAWQAWLRINKVLRDHVNNPCGFSLTCIGPTVDIKTGKACPINTQTGLPWADPVEAD